MYKKIFFLSLFFFSQLLMAYTKGLIINGHEFVVETESYNLYGSRGTAMKLYDANRSRDVALLRLTLNDATGDCTQRSLEDGSYEIEDNNITLYTLWRQQGDAYLAPYGTWIQKFEVLKNGELKKVTSKIYLEETKRGYDEESGMQYLFKTPKNDAEKEKLTQYIQNIEKKYEAEFLLGGEKEALFREVKKALKRKVKNMWQKQ